MHAATLEPDDDILSDEDDYLPPDDMSDDEMMDWLEGSSSPKKGMEETYEAR